MEEKKIDNSIIRLINPEFVFEFMGKEYTLRKATLDKAVQYQTKARELQDSKDPASDAKLVSYCIYIMLKSKIDGLTEETVFENVPADIDTMEILTTLGFINPSKMEKLNQIQEEFKKTLIGEKSS